MRLGFLKLLGTLRCDKICTYTYYGNTIKRSEKALFDDDYAIFFLIFFIKACRWYSFELHRLVDAIQMRTHNICLYKKVNKKYTGCNLKTMEIHECALIGICAVIRLNTVVYNSTVLDTPFKDHKNV